MPGLPAHTPCAPGRRARVPPGPASDTENTNYPSVNRTRENSSGRLAGRRRAPPGRVPPTLRGLRAPPASDEVDPGGAVGVLRGPCGGRDALPAPQPVVLALVVVPVLSAGDAVADGELQGGLGGGGGGGAQGQQEGEAVGDAVGRPGRLVRGGSLGAAGPAIERVAHRHDLLVGEVEDAHGPAQPRRLCPHPLQPHLVLPHPLREAGAGAGLRREQRLQQRRRRPEQHRLQVTQRRRLPGLEEVGGARRRRRGQRHPRQVGLAKEVHGGELQPQRVGEAHGLAARRALLQRGAQAAVAGRGQRFGAAALRGAGGHGGQRGLPAASRRRLLVRRFPHHGRGRGVAVGAAARPALLGQAAIEAGAAAEVARQEEPGRRPGHGAVQRARLIHGVPAVPAAGAAPGAPPLGPRRADGEAVLAPGPRALSLCRTQRDALGAVQVAAGPGGCRRVHVCGGGCGTAALRLLPPVTCRGQAATHAPNHPSFPIAPTRPSARLGVGLATVPNYTPRLPLPAVPSTAATPSLSSSSAPSSSSSLCSGSFLEDLIQKEEAAGIPQWKH